MTYTALGPSGARVAVAVSSDLFHWTRLGLVEFGEEGGKDFDALENKDAVFFAQQVTAPDGTLSFACLHRPMTGADRRSRTPWHLAHLPSSIWLSWVPVTDVQHDLRALTRLRHHHLLLTPGYSWEQMKVGAGTPPMLTRLGWLVFHHGVQSADLPGSARRWRYSAGAFVLDSQDLTRVIWRSPSPLLAPHTPDETYGVVDNVVFPTGVDVVDERTLDLYYGMADARIGAARVRLNEGAALHRLDGTGTGQALPGPGSPLSPASHRPHLASKVDDIDERIAA
jgi:predicted GH43/DUF377 family glycosyl hydrolase